MTRVINIHSGEPYDVYIGRAGKGLDGYFGNPVRLSREQDRPTVLRRYRAYLWRRVNADPEFRRRVIELKGKTLCCFCAPKPCHGDVIVKFLEWLDTPAGQEWLAKVEQKGAK